MTEIPAVDCKRKLRPLVITMGGKRKEYISEMFSHPAMAPYFEPPAFSPGVPQRELRNRMGLMTHAGKAGIIPQPEWEALSSPQAKILNEDDPKTLFEVLDDVPVEPGRLGSDFDVKLHYSIELWQKAKGINRGRSVLACSLAHLIAMRTLVEDGYDFILEDNVRAAITNPEEDDTNADGEIYCECAERIWSAKQASVEWESATRQMCHLRYYGWLGSRPNLEFVMNVHRPQMQFARKEEGSDVRTVFPFPIESDVEKHLGKDSSLSASASNMTSAKAKAVEAEEREKADNNKDKRTKPGGTPIFGAFAYWVSAEGYDAIIKSLQKDVGGMLWKGKRMRCHQVKPIDKIIPRRIKTSFSKTDSQDGRKHIHVATHPAFFRAPMLTSQIHSQWDPEFCRSSEYQMNQCNRENGEDGQAWRHLWLTKDESDIVDHRAVHGKWLTLTELAETRETQSSS